MLASAGVMGLVYGLSEAGLSLFKRARKDASISVDQDQTDQGSLQLIWRTILICMILAFVTAAQIPQAQFPIGDALYAIAVTAFVGGLALRWSSIFWLGKFFTVNVAIAADQRVVDTGPYRFIRHPSYTGALAAFLGLAILTGNWLSLPILMLPVVWVFNRRINIEEAALRSGLGEAYEAYSRRTWRLIPLVY